MTIYVGNERLGTSPDEVDPRTVGGLVGSGRSEIQRARGKCDGPVRLGLRGNPVGSFTVPTVREFATVSEAARYVWEISLAGAVEGALTVEFDDTTSSSAEWAIATPSNLQHKGVLVTATWAIEAGAKL